MAGSEGQGKLKAFDTGFQHRLSEAIFTSVNCPLGASIALPSVL